MEDEMKKILFCDMDGTIINKEGLLHEPDKVMLERYCQSPHLFAFNTGRNIEEALRATSEFDLPYDYLVLNNGAHIVDRHGNEIFKRVIEKQVGVDIIEHCLQYSDMWIQYFDGKNTIVYFNGQTYEYGNSGFVQTDRFDFIKEYKNVEEFDIIAINQDNEGIDEVLKIQKYIQDNYASVAHGTLNTHYLDITPSDCTKGTGITSLVELLEEDVVSYAIGDSYNDISMFEHADHGYTFNHVGDEIKQHSDKQVDYLEELLDEMLK